MLAALSAALLMTQAPPQFGATRMEMGERVKRLDAAWLRNRRPAVRRAAVVPISSAVTFFFSGRFGEACRALDEATARLEGRELRLADAVILRPTKYVLDGDAAMEVQLTWAYDIPGARLASWEGLPLKAGVPLVKRYPVRMGGDGRIRQRTVFSSGERVWVESDRISAFDSRMEALEKSDHPEVKALVGLIKASAEGPTETTFRLADLMREAESLARGVEREGSHEVKLAIHNGVPLRAWIPAKPRAIVVALHGAGGSENMFFETYGAGLGWKEAQRRNWVFVSPRSGANSVGASLEWLEAQYGLTGLPVFVMGHSMGGGIAANSAGFGPTAVALFAPATAQLSVEMLKIPVFLGVGEQEIPMLATGSRRIGDQLSANPASVYKAYPNCEHLMIVADALPDAYKFFDTALKNREKLTPEGKI